jgi:hypothetical protein
MIIAVHGRPFCGDVKGVVYLPDALPHHALLRQDEHSGVLSPAVAGARIPFGNQDYCGNGDGVYDSYGVCQCEFIDFSLSFFYIFGLNQVWLAGTLVSLLMGFCGYIGFRVSEETEPGVGPDVPDGLQ